LSGGIFEVDPSKRAVSGETTFLTRFTEVDRVLVLAGGVGLWVWVETCEKVELEVKGCSSKVSESDSWESSVFRETGYVYTVEF